MGEHPKGNSCRAGGCGGEADGKASGEDMARRPQRLGL